MTTIEPREILSVEEALIAIKRVLVLCPAYDRPTIQTSEFLSALSAVGAVFLIRTGVSDVATARNLMAADALECIERQPDRFDTVFWLDADMTGSPHHVAALAYLAKLHDVAVVGRCCPRNDTNTLAAKLLLDDTIRSPTSDIELLPVYAGLACMALPITHFLDVCACVETFKLAHCKRAPAICQSRMTIQSGFDEEQWLSEDMYFCRLLWTYARGVYYAPIEFGHVTSLAVFPNSSARFIEECEKIVNGTPDTLR